MNIIKLMGGIIRSLINRVSYMYANRNDQSKRNYLRKHDCIVGNKTRFIGKIDGFGSEPHLIEIGEDCLISDNVHFHTHDGGVKVLNAAGYFSCQRMDKMARIKVGNNCFLGSGCRIMMGVTIGDNCIIGTNSVVTRSVPDNSVVAGMPAKVICTHDEYYKKNTTRNVFFPTPEMSQYDKRNYLIKNVPKI